MQKQALYGPERLTLFNNKLGVVAHMRTLLEEKSEDNYVFGQVICYMFKECVDVETVDGRDIVQDVKIKEAELDDWNILNETHELSEGLYRAFTDSSISRLTNTIFSLGQRIATLEQMHKIDDLNPAEDGSVPIVHCNLPSVKKEENLTPKSEEGSENTSSSE